MQRLLHIFILLLIMAVAGTLGFMTHRWLNDGGSSMNAEGSAKLTFSLPDTDGTLRTENDWANSWRLVNFWATWCPPCVEEMPLLDEIQKENAAAPLHVIGIALDDAESVQQFTQRVPVSFPLLIAESSGSRITREWGNSKGALPYTVLLNPAGEAVHRWTGALKADSIRPQLAELMGQQR